jgi:hypothetical protein
MTDLTLICETCGFPIAEGSGCIYTTFAEMHTSSDEIHWHTSHYAHLAAGFRDTYEIDSGRIATWPRLAWWTAHLMEKNWFALSDWDDLLREVAGEIPSRRIRVAAKEAA